MPSPSELNDFSGTECFDHGVWNVGLVFTPEHHGWNGFCHVLAPEAAPAIYGLAVVPAHRAV